VVGAFTTTSLSADANGFFPDLTVANRTSVVWKQNGSSFTSVLTTTDPVPGPKGDPGNSGAKGDKGDRGDLAAWQPNTFYPLNQVISNQTGDLVKVTTAHTSGASYDASKFGPIAIQAGGLTGTVPDAALPSRLSDTSLTATYATPATAAAAAAAQLDAAPKSKGDKLRRFRSALENNSVNVIACGDSWTEGTRGADAPNLRFVVRRFGWTSSSRILQCRSFTILGISIKIARFNHLRYECCAGLSWNQVKVHIDPHHDLTHLPVLDGEQPVSHQVRHENCHPWMDREPIIRKDCPVGDLRIMTEYLILDLAVAVRQQAQVPLEVLD